MSRDTSDQHALIAALMHGEAALGRGDHGAAADAFADAHARMPTDVGLALALANAQQLAGRLEARIGTLQHTFAHGDRSELAVAHALGGALLEVGEAGAAVTCFEEVRAARPDDPAALSALAAALRAAGEPARAWPLARRACELAPKQGAQLLTAAQVRHDLGDLLGALGWLDKAERARPGHGPTRFQRAMSTLLRGASSAGWAQFEARPLPTPANDSTAWTGEPLDGRSVLVTAEQGIGDQLQFLRFVPRLAAAGAGRVQVEAHTGLLTLLRANGLEVVPRGAAPASDLHVPLLSLPHRLRLGAQVDGDRVPYVRSVGGAPPLPPRTDGRRRLGLVWAGNPAFPGRATRDLSAAVLPAIAEIPSFDWISLQQGRAAEVDVPGLIRGPALADWCATAAALAQLDGLVTTDTGIAHLAGAMGVPTWVLLQKVPDWRWGLSGERTPWYPTLTLIRQPAWNDWRGVVDALSRALVSSASVPP